MTLTSAGLVPELLITDLATSLNFWVTLCGFEILHDRPREGFAYLHCGTAHIMLEQIGVGRNWIPGTLERPLGRSVNLQVTEPAIMALVERLTSSDWPLFMAPEGKRYQTGERRLECPSSLSKTTTGTWFDSLHG
jgi:catechol 2,3-dioxygenase-like lactoylglutathione lyase family enzyme